MGCGNIAPLEPEVSMSFVISLDIDSSGSKGTICYDPFGLSYAGLCLLNQLNVNMHGKKALLSQNDANTRELVKLGIGEVRYQWLRMG